MAASSSSSFPKGKYTKKIKVEEDEDKRDGRTTKKVGKWNAPSPRLFDETERVPSLSPLKQRWLFSIVCSSSFPWKNRPLIFFFLLLKLSLDPNKCRDGGNIDLIIKIKKHFLIELFRRPHPPTKGLLPAIKKKFFSTRSLSSSC